MRSANDNMWSFSAMRVWRAVHENDTLNIKFEVLPTREFNVMRTTFGLDTIDTGVHDDVTRPMARKR